MIQKGTYFWADGQRYEGEWKNDKIHNKGKLNKSPF